MKWQTIYAYGVHVLTASGIVCSFFSIIAIIDGDFRIAFLLNAIAILIDSFDGMFARHANVKKYGSRIDGALMDNIIDFVTYTVMPAFFFFYTPLLEPTTRTITLSALLLSSIFQFSNTKAKTEDHFFLGFPSYWNIVVFYLWIWGLSPVVNTIIVWALSVLSFIPIKFLYPSRLDYFSKSALFRYTFFGATILWGICTFLMIFSYPTIPGSLHIGVIAYIAWYTYLSLVRTMRG